MTQFNEGKSYHGSRNVSRGKLKGSTDSQDYFYFLCPNCGGKEIMRILEYEVRAHEEENEYNKSYTKKAVDGFTLAFHIFCERCQLDDFVKIANTGWQQGNIEEKL